MKKWICNVCGYTHTGNECPESCPRCNAPQSAFYEKGRMDWRALAIIVLISTMVVLMVSIVSCTSETVVNNSAVKTVDVNRYLGKWYEIARFDHRFERGLSHCMTLYSMEKDGKIRVVNQGMKDGIWKTSKGNAKMTDVPGVLRVSFFGPFYSDYRIMMLAPDYSYALVGGSSEKYLWILARSSTLPPNTQEAILREAQKRGYDTSRLLWVEQ